MEQADDRRPRLSFCFSRFQTCVLSNVWRNRVKYRYKQKDSGKSRWAQWLCLIISRHVDSRHDGDKGQRNTNGMHPLSAGKRCLKCLNQNIFYNKTFLCVVYPAFAFNLLQRKMAMHNNICAPSPEFINITTLDNKEKGDHTTRKFTIQKMAVYMQMRRQEVVYFTLKTTDWTNDDVNHPMNC